MANLEYKLILASGYPVKVDKADFNYLDQFKWHINSWGYAYRHISKNRKNKIAMHREIIKAENGYDVDHINHNKLDNRRINLRVCSRSQNNMNRNKGINTSSIYKGVTWDKSKKRWQSQINKDYKHIFIGRYLDEKEAALAYDLRAKSLFGSFAKLNFV